jgi:hypothetical protein
MLLFGQQLQDQPDLVTRVFKIKLKELINDIHKKHIMGCTIAGIYVIEFQKRGLPHAHILIFFAEHCKSHTVKDVDHMISAEFSNPKTNKLAHETIAKCMMHGLCGAAFPNAPCMENDNVSLPREGCGRITIAIFRFSKCTSRCIWPFWSDIDIKPPWGQACLS